MCAGFLQQGLNVFQVVHFVFSCCNRTSLTVFVGSFSLFTASAFVVEEFGKHCEAQRVFAPAGVMQAAHPQ